MGSGLLWRKYHVLKCTTFLWHLQLMNGWKEKQVIDIVLYLADTLNAVDGSLVSASSDTLTNTSSHSFMMFHYQRVATIVSNSFSTLIGWFYAEYLSLLMSYMIMQRIRIFTLCIFSSFQELFLKFLPTSKRISWPQSKLYTWWYMLPALLLNVAAVQPADSESDMSTALGCHWHPTSQYYLTKENLKTSLM